MKFAHRFKTEMMSNLLALLSGAMLTLAFAPFSLFPLAIFSLAILLTLWLKASPKKAFLLGFLFGIGSFSTGVYWVFISIHTYGNASVLLAGIITGGFIGILALFPAVVGFLLNRYFPYNNDSKILFAFPALWLIIEWVRSWIFTGFPWLSLGYSQIHSPLKGYATIFSVYGVSLAVLFSSGFFVNIIIKLRQRSYQSAMMNVGLLCSLWIIGALLSFFTWTTPKGEPIQVSLVQGNISQDIKWSNDQILPTLKHYQDLTNAHWDSKIIVWPEAAIPLPLQNAAEYLSQLANDAEQHKATVITGIPTRHNTKDTYYNAIIAIGSSYSYYLKQKLVPFGEYTPFPKLLSALLGHFNIPMSDMIPGEEPVKPLLAQGLKIAAFICYEIAFPQLVNQRDKDINLLLTVSNDAWFGHSIASAQHLEMAQMRALELGRPLLFVSNTGLTAIVKPNGNIQSSIPPYQSAVLTDKIQPMFGKTIWQKRGMDGIFIVTIVLLISAMRLQKKPRKQAS